MRDVDSILFAKWLIPVDNHSGPLTVLENHAVIVDKTKIIAITDWQNAKAQFRAENTTELLTHVVMPGLINTHTHSPMALFRGLADDLTLMEWLNENIWPAERKLCDEEFIRDGMLLACAEMIRSGTTCFNEHYFFPQTTAQVVEEIGMRASISLFMIDFPTSYANTPEEHLAKAEHVLENSVATELIRYTLGPHSPYACSDDLLKKLKQLQMKYQIPVHMHVHETRSEVTHSMDTYGMRPLIRLQKLGLLGPHFINVHVTQMNDEDLAIIKDSHSHVVHCPESNLKLASGYCQVQKLLDNGVNVSLGTDGAASNNDLDMFGEMRTAAFIGKTIADDPTAVSAQSVLKMATINGAKVLGLKDVIGRLAVGFSADMIAVNMEKINTQPLYNPISHIVYATNSQQVSDVWVAGKQLLRQGQLTTIDEQNVIRTAQKWQAKIKASLHAKV